MKTINIEQAKRVFPLYMKQITLPAEAKPEAIKVYRICKTGKVEPESFLTTYVEYERKNSLGALNLLDVASYSLSCWEKAKDARRYLIFFTKKAPKAIASAGITAESCGIVQRTRERQNKNAKSHVDWWLYEDALPHKHFKEVNLNE